MTHRGILYLPDGVGMLILMGVLLYLRRGSHAKDATMWLIGLSFILLEGLAADSYKSGTMLHALTHSAALSCYVLAAFAFMWAIKRPSLPGTTVLIFSSGWLVPMLGLCVLYGQGFKSSAVLQAFAGLGLLQMLVLMAWHWKRARNLAWFAAAEFVAWGPMLWTARHGVARETVYWGMGCLYLATGLLMTRLIKRSTSGGVVVVLGFATWAACLFTHPYITPGTVMWALVDQVWTLQKFFVTIGLLLVMLDEERRDNLTLALYDPLTNLPNRRLLNDRLGQAIQWAGRTRTSFAFFLVDLNGFKAVNDEMGHEAGDRVLLAAAERLQRAVRSSDTLARWGGDEFAVVVNDVRDRPTCELMRASFTASLRVDPDSGLVPLSGSVGYAMFPQDGRELDELLNLADRRMYDAKHIYQAQMALA